MRFSRQFRYIYLRLIRLRGNPHELALGMAFGIFIGMTPTLPFQTIFAITLALLFKASKITAALGTWISNPFTVYLIYKYCYKIGLGILGFDHNTKLLKPVIEAINQGEFLNIITTILSGGGVGVQVFLLGGILLGISFAVPSYFIFFYFFKIFISWRKSRKSNKH
jgi:uncharacterized protein